MAKVKLNPVLEGFRGKIGDLVFKRYRDEVVVGRVPDTGGRTPTARQAAHRERFRLATVYGSTVVADPATKAVYEPAAKQKGLTVFALTIADFLNAPAVDEIDLSAYTGKTGEPICIRASDDFEVAGVEVSLTDAGGRVLERGTATKAGTDSLWTYTTTTNLPDGQPVSIEVTATDRPGHKTTKTQVKP
jgi:hypothetical protein